VRHCGWQARDPAGIRHPVESGKFAQSTRIRYSEEHSDENELRDGGRRNHRAHFDRLSARTSFLEHVRYL
jgi:hypothetical protein